MPSTSAPSYTEAVDRPLWQTGSETNATGQRRVVSGKDQVKAMDINNLREIIDIMYGHTHDYTDNTGGC